MNFSKIILNVTFLQILNKNTPILDLFSRNCFIAFSIKGKHVLIVRNGHNQLKFHVDCQNESSKKVSQHAQNETLLWKTKLIHCPNLLQFQNQFLELRIISNLRSKKSKKTYLEAKKRVIIQKFQKETNLHLGPSLNLFLLFL